MKKAFFILFTFAASYSSLGQYIATTKNADGYLKMADRTFVQKTTTFIEEGSKSLPEKNCAVILNTKDGKRYNKVNGHIDLQTGVFIFVVEEHEYECLVPIERIIFDSCNSTLDGAICKTGYPPIDKQNEKSLYHVLSEGNASLLKYYAVRWQDLIPFNSTNTTRVYSQIQQYYLYLNGKMLRLEKNKDNLRSLLGPAKEYIFINNLNLKKEEDAIKLLAYYNSL